MAVSQSGFHNIASPFVNGMAITLPPIPIQQQERDVVYVSNKYISTDITIIQPAFSRGSFSQSQQDSALQPFCSMDSHSVLDKAPRLSIRRVVWILASDTVFVQLNL